MNRLNFSVENIEEVKDSANKDFITAKIKAFADGDNRHHLYISEDTLKNAADTIYDKPLVWVYDENTDDIGSHDPKETPVGFIHRENNPIEFEDTDDGRHMLTINAKIWKKYSGSILDFFKRDGFEKPVSVEIEFPPEAQTQNDDGMTEITEFTFQCITILGSNVTPAIPDACCITEEFAIAKENYLKEFAEKSKIEIDNSKESAVGENAKWSNPGRKLYNPIINASNKQALAKEAYLVIEGEDWEESPSTSLKYPHHVIKDGKLVVSISGVQAAFQRASQQGIVEGDVKAHLLRHYRELGLNEENFQEKEERDLPINEEENKVEEFALTASQIDCLLYNALESCNLWTRTHDDEYVYFYSYNDKCCYRAKYTIVDGVAQVDLESKERVIEGAYQLASDISSEVVDSKDFEEEKIDKEDDEEEEDFQSKCAEYEQTIAKMQADIDVYMAELTELREYKAQREDGDTKFAIAELFNEVKDVLPKEQFEEFEEEAKEVKFEALESFKNKVKAKTLDFALPGMKSEINRMAISAPIKEEKKKSFWSK
nr:MAG TPA: hypothetical protein [Caudoviricetes sp.]